MKQSLHAISPVQNFVLVAGNLKSLAFLFVPHDCDVGQSLLTCTGMSLMHFALSESWRITDGQTSANRQALAEGATQKLTGADNRASTYRLIDHS